MKKLMVGLAGAVVLLAAFSYSPSARTETPARAAKIGVVDLKKCFDGARYVRIKDAGREYTAFTDELRTRYEQIKNKADAQQEVAKMARDAGYDDFYAREMEKYLLLKYQAEMISELNKRKAVARYREMQLEIYNGIRAVVDEYAKENGYDLVLKIDEPKLKEGSIESVQRRINHRPVLFHSSALDITDKIIEQLNAENRRQTRGRKP